MHFRLGCAARSGRTPEAMNIYIAGGGRVGYHLARLLSVENHDVTVIENDPLTVEHVDYALDVSTVRGSTTSVMLLKEAGVADADLFVSVTGEDEANLIAAATAKGLGAKQAVARVDHTDFIESNILYETILGVDYILSPNALTALEMVQYIETPGMVAAEEFGRGLVQMRQMRVARTPTEDGKTLKDITFPQGVLLGVISRGGMVLVPRGDTVVEPGDVVTVIGQREQMDAVQRMFRGVETKPEKIFIMGGGTVGLHLAQVLENRQRSVKLFDWNMERCKELAAELKRTKVVYRDATSRATLEQEHVVDADVFVATTHDDERNIMASVLAKEVGVPRTIAVVHQPDFAPLVTKLGIDHAVTPRACFANRVLRLVHQRRIAAMAVLEEGDIQILEFDVTDGSPAVNKPLKETTFPRDALVGTILRGEKVIVPGGDDQLQPGDSVILIATPDSIEAVQKLFQR
jgi:trk/ktr system potassium uptake protein